MVDESSALREVVRRVRRLATPRFRVARVWPLLLLGVLLAWVTIWTPYANSPAIRSDGAGYHAWTRALLRGNLSFCLWSERETGIIAYRDPERNYCQNKFGPGLALLRLPVMALVIDRGEPLDSIEIAPAEHTASLIIGATFVWAQAVLMLWTTALLRLNAWRSSIAVLCAIFGTGLFHYGTYDGSFTHAYSSFFCALLLALAARERARHRPMPALALGLSAFFLLSIRLTNLILLATLVLAYFMFRRGSIRSSFTQKLLPIGLGAGIALAIQLAYNYYSRGVLSGYSYGDEQFLWDRPMQLAVLLSYERGLFTYSPVYAFALICGLAVRAARKFAVLLAVLVALYTGLYGFWHSWTLGGGLGHRGFVELAPLVALVLALAWNKLGTRLFVPLGVSAAAATLVTLQVMAGYWSGRFPMGGATETQYWNQMQTIESVLTGGSTCRVSRCHVWPWNCTIHNEPDFAFCMANLVHAGNCLNEGQCVPIVALKSLAGVGPSYVSSAPPRKRESFPLLAGAQGVGSWEKFALVGDPEQPSRIRLFALASRRYVSIPQRKDASQALAARSRTPGTWETFVRVGTGQAVALRAWNGKYVSATGGPTRWELVANASRIGTREQFAIEYVRP